MEAFQDWLAGWHDWLKALHIIAVITWMAGLFYLPRLFVYHAERAPAGSEMSETFKVMERKLLKLIINPSSIVVWVVGILLLFSLGWEYFKGNHWLHVKLVMVALMSVYHHMLVIFWRQFAEDRNTRSGRAYRLWNEAPTLLLLVIVPMAVVKPF